MCNTIANKLYMQISGARTTPKEQIVGQAINVDKWSKNTPKEQIMGQA